MKRVALEIGKLESLNSEKFGTLSHQQMQNIVGKGSTGAGMAQNGVPLWKDETATAPGHFVVPVRLWSSDSLENGVMCYYNERTGYINATY